VAIGGVAVLGDVLLDIVETDKPKRAYDVTSKAVEDGVNISDHMHERPTTLSISGMILGNDAWTRFQRIIRYQQNRQLITYTNRVIHSNMAITNIDTTHGGDTSNGLKFTIHMKHVRRARPQQAQITNVPPTVVSKAQVGQNAGTRQPEQTDKKAGDKISDARLAYLSNDFSGGGTGGGRGTGGVRMPIGMLPLIMMPTMIATQRTV
jgi:hypothetical protein